MKKILKILLKIGIPIVIIAAVILATVFSNPSVEPKYGIKEGSIALLSNGDITGDVMESQEPVLVAENDNLQLYLDNTCNIVLKDLSSGRQYSSKVSKENASYFVDKSESMNSICSLTYLASDGTEQSMDASKDAVDKKQFSISKIKNGVSVSLVLGQSSEKESIPKAVEKTKFEERILKKLNSDNKNFLKRMYTLYDQKTVEKHNQEDLLEEIPEIKNKSFYVLNNISGAVTKKKLEKVFSSIDYSQEDINDDNKESGYKGVLAQPCFMFDMEFSIDDNSLKLNIPNKSIKYYRDYPLMTITPIKYFASESGESGAVLVPSGSGAVCCFNNNSTTGNYSASFYGVDDNKTSDGVVGDMTIYDDYLSFPFFAMQTAKDYITANIDSSAEEATFYMTRQNNSMLCYPTFTVVQSDRSYISSKKSTIVFADNANNSDITVTYKLGTTSSDEIIDYSKIANEYRNYLLKQDLLTKDDSKISLLLEYVGAVKCNREYFGLVNGKGLMELTDFETMSKITSDISKSTTRGELNVKISGWNADGMYASKPGKYSPLKVLGGKNGLNRLFDDLKSISKNVYLEENHAYIYDYVSSGYSKSHLIKLIDSSVGKIDGFNIVDGMRDENLTSFGVVSPKYYKEISDDNIKNGIKSVSVGRLASVLNSDYNSKQNVLRKDAVDYVKSTLSNYKKNKVSVLSNDANLYALNSVDLIENMPCSSLGDSKLFAYDIPFKQMICHGYVNSVCSPINSTTNHKVALLKAIETGTGISYLFTENVNEKLASTEFSFLFYSSYDLSKEEVKEYWTVIQEALSGLEDKEITEHKMKDNVSYTTYEDNTVICVNYNDSSFETPYGVVEPMSYIRFSL